MTDDAERFKWNLLGDLCFEDTYRLVDILIKAQSEPRLTDVEKLFWSTLKSLEAENSIRLYRPEGVPEIGGPPTGELVSLTDLQAENADAGLILMGE